MAQHLSQPRIENTVYLVPNDIQFLHTSLFEAETVAHMIGIQVDKLEAQISELALQKDAKLAEIALFHRLRRRPLKIFSRVFKLPRSFEHSRDNHIISLAEVVVQTIENRVEDLGAHISKLKLERDGKIVEIASLHNLIAPVRRLPPEILSEIFQLSLNQKSLPDTGIVCRMFTLTGICVAWRNVIQATPQLWSRLSISVKKHFLGSDLGWVHDWITRCQGIALDLTLDFHLREYELLGICMSREKQLLDHILSHFGHKIQSLKMEGYPSSFIPLLQGSLPSVEDVSFTIHQSLFDRVQHLVDLFPKKSKVFLGAPRLHCFEINSIPFLGLLALPAQQLGFFQVYDPLHPGFESDPVLYMDILVAPLPQCSQLVSLEISLPSNLQHSTEMNTILLPALRTLIMSYIPANNILAYVTAPLLEGLMVCYPGEDLDSLVADMTSFQQRSVTAGLSFLSLTLPSPNFPENSIFDVITILSLFPTIHALSLRVNLNLDPLLQAMIYDTIEDSHHHFQLLPNLTDLKMKGDYSLSASKLKSMVLSRWWPDEMKIGELVMVHDEISRLQKVTVHLPYLRNEWLEDLWSISLLSGFVLDCKTWH